MRISGIITKSHSPPCRNASRDATSAGIKSDKGDEGDPGDAVHQGRRRQQGQGDNAPQGAVRGDGRHDGAGLQPACVYSC